MKALITTSWDDGHPLDLRVADLLQRYGLTGTFYIPAETERPTLTPCQVRELATTFEVGAHTVRHVDLLRVADEIAQSEIAGSKAWVEDATGTRCELFCFPKGHFSRRHITMVRQAGFQGARTVEQTSLLPARLVDQLWLMPTTVQAYRLPPAALTRNWTKRRALGNAWNWVRFGRTLDWLDLTRRLVDAVSETGGVFHLWGHSWEIDEYDDWERLEEAFRLLGEFARSIPCVPNRAILPA